MLCETRLIGDLWLVHVASQWCDSEPGHVPGPFYEAAGTPTAARSALQETPAAVRTLCRDDSWPAGGSRRGQQEAFHSLKRTLVFTMYFNVVEELCYLFKPLSLCSFFLCCPLFPQVERFKKKMIPCFSSVSTACSICWWGAGDCQSGAL